MCAVCGNALYVSDTYIQSIATHNTHEYVYPYLNGKQVSNNKCLSNFDIQLPTIAPYMPEGPG